MKVAVSALGPGLDDKVDEHFGRACWFVVSDTEGTAFEAVDNGANRNAMQGAGIAAAELVADNGAEAVLTGHLGPKAYQALDMAGIPGYSAAGMTVAEALEAFDQGKLARLEETAETHGG